MKKYKLMIIIALLIAAVIIIGITYGGVTEASSGSFVPRCH